MKARVKKQDYLYDVEELENTMLCARWLVHQFEQLNFSSIARLFQNALNDAEAWIETMAKNGELSDDCVEPIRAQEAKIIHNILVKYASIDDPDMRDDILDQMLRITKQQHH